MLAWRRPCSRRAEAEHHVGPGRAVAIEIANNRARCAERNEVEIEFIGAAQAVTGSKHVVRTKQATVLLDCGLFQGRRREAQEKNRTLGVNPLDLDAVVLSHAHLDHSGALPVLAKRGFNKAIYATPPTRSLCAAMLEDSAHIQASDARYHEKLRIREGRGGEPIVPLYEEPDVARLMSLMTAVPYHQPQMIAPGVRLTFLDAGHVLGSAIVVLDIEEGSHRTRLAFTGDLGRTGAALMRDPEVPEGTEWLIMESTYGDRIREPIELRDSELEAALWRVHARGGKVIIPAFALERAQEVLYALHALRDRGRLPRMPVFVDSPLTVKITDVFRLHPESLDADARSRFRGRSSPFDFPELTYVTDKEESKAIDAMEGPAVILSASGMCEGGRVVHHLRALIGDARNLVLMVGFQAQHTLGRRLVENAKRVRIFGVERRRHAEVVVLDGFSAHADQTELLGFAEAVQQSGPLRGTFLVHGELPAQRELKSALEDLGIRNVAIPAPGERFACKHG